MKNVYFEVFRMPCRNAFTQKVYHFFKNLKVVNPADMILSSKLKPIRRKLSNKIIVNMPAARVVRKI